MICQAINARRLMQLTYNYGARVVEPHAYGMGNKNHELLRAFQVSGYSEQGETYGWKLFRVDEVQSMKVLEDTFAGSRPGYVRNDKALKSIYCQL